MIELDLEKRIVAAVAALGVSGLEVRGLWNPVAAGLVKGEETDASVPAAAAVRVSPRAYNAVTFPEVTFDCVIAIVVRTDLDPTGSIVAAVAEAVSGLLARLHRTVAHGRNSSLDVAGFEVAAFHSVGGVGPDFDRTSATWSVNYNFTVVGVVSDADLQPTTQEES